MNDYKSNEINELFAALAKAQAEMPIVGETASNTFFKSKYAKFSDIIKATRPCLTKNGLAIIQRLQTIQDVNILVTILAHSSGQYIESSIKIQPDKNDIQSLGKTISYLKRYQLLSIITAVTSDDPDDDDGEADRQKQSSYQPRPYQQPSKVEAKIEEKPVDKTLITPEQLELIEEELADDIDLADRVMKRLNITSLSQMKRNDFKLALDGIRKIKEKK